MKTHNNRKLKTAALVSLFLAPLASAATLIAGYEFNANGVDEGWTGTNVTGLTTTGGFIQGTAAGNDPQLRNNAANLTIGSGQTWDSVVFRVREIQNEDPAGTVTEFNATGLVIMVNYVTVPLAQVNDIAKFTAVESGDGFFTVTADISGITATTLHELRVDPIGGAASNSNSETNGNTFELDFIRVYAVPEPSSALLGGLGVLALLRRRR